MEPYSYFALGCRHLQAAIILDEPTAALDSETELALLDNLKEWGQRRVILLITHRLSTIRQADHIVYVQDGQIVESGSQAELRTRERGTYRRLIERKEPPMG